MTTDLQTLAASLARVAHAGQVDKAGRDYFTAHLLPIADHLRPFGEYAWAAGVLHDIVEDTSVGYQELLEAGVPPEVVGAVRAVTRVPGERYAQLIERAAAHPLGRLVKLADNWHNLQGQDELMLTDPELSAGLRRRYTRAREVLEAALIS